MQIEDIAGISLAARRALEDQRHLAVSHGLLGEIIVYDKRVATRVAEIFADGYSRERREITHRRRLRSTRRYNHRIRHGAELLQRVDDGCHRGGLLAYRNIYAVHRFAGVIVLLLVDYGVDGYGCLTCLTVADDELALSAAYRNHRVDSLETGLQRGSYRLTEYDTGGLALERHANALPLDWPFAVDRLAEHVHDASQKTLAYRYRRHFARTLHRHVLGDAVDLVEKHYAHIALLKVEGHAFGSILELHKLIAPYILKTIDMSHTVAGIQHRAYFLEFYL